MTDTCFLSHLAQAQSAHPFFGQNFNSSLDERVFQIAVMVFFSVHVIILPEHLDTVKINTIILTTSR